MSPNFAPTRFLGLLNCHKIHDILKDGWEAVKVFVCKSDVFVRRRKNNVGTLKWCDEYGKKVVMSFPIVEIFPKL